VEDFNCENEHRYGKGFYNEFGIDTALGFEETNEGDWFHKIGVGLLQKEGTHYDFQKSYKIKAATFSTRIELQAFFMSCIAPNVHGYAYQLHKEIVLQEAGFNINYTLMNTGQKSIRTDEYAHNFMAFNQAEIDTNYQLKLPFNLHPTFFGETDFKSNKINLWGWSHVISPEIFHEINIAPNETAQWTRTYEIFEL